MEDHGTLTPIGQCWSLPLLVSVSRIPTRCLEQSIDHFKCLAQVLERFRICHKHYGVSDQGLHGIMNLNSLRNNLLVVNETVSRVLECVLMVFDMLSNFVKCY